MGTEFHFVAQAVFEFLILLSLSPIRIIMYYCTLVLTFPYLLVGKIGKCGAGRMVVGTGSCYIVQIGLGLTL